jgi:hypothetical protein
MLLNSRIAMRDSNSCGNLGRCFHSDRNYNNTHIRIMYRAAMRLLARVIFVSFIISKRKKRKLDHNILAANGGERQSWFMHLMTCINLDREGGGGNRIKYIIYIPAHQSRWLISVVQSHHILLISFFKNKRLISFYRLLMNCFHFETNKIKKLSAMTTGGFYCYDVGISTLSVW